MLHIASSSVGARTPTVEDAQDSPRLGAPNGMPPASERVVDFLEHYRRYLGDPPPGMSQVGQRMLAAEAIKTGPWRDDRGLSRVRGMSFLDRVKQEQTRLQDAVQRLHPEKLRVRDVASMSDPEWTERALGEVQASVRSLLVLRIKPVRSPQWPERILAIVPRACTDEMTDFNSYAFRDDLGIPVAVFFVLRKLLVRDDLPLLPALGSLSLQVLQPLVAHPPLTPLDAHRMLDISPLTLARGVAAVLGEVITLNLSRAGAGVAAAPSDLANLAGNNLEADPFAASPMARVTPGLMQPISNSTPAPAPPAKSPQGRAVGPTEIGPSAGAPLPSPAAAAGGEAAAEREAHLGERRASPQSMSPRPHQGGGGQRPLGATPTASDSGWSEAARALAALRDVPAGSGAHSSGSGNSRDAVAGLEALRTESHRLKAQVALYETFCKPLPQHIDLAGKAEMAAHFILPAEHLAQVCDGRKDWQDIVSWRRQLLVQAVAQGRAAAKQSLVDLKDFILNLRRSPGESHLKILPDFSAESADREINSYAFHPRFRVLTFMVVILEAVFAGQAELLSQLREHLDYGRRYPRRTRANKTTTQGRLEPSHALQQPARLINEDLMVGVINGLGHGGAHMDPVAASEMSGLA